MPDAEFETYRGAVAASECDAFGHLNIAFYPERFAAAALDALERAGLGEDWRTSRLDTRYLRELRAGDGLILRSKLVAKEPGAVLLLHEGMTPSGEATTSAEHRLWHSSPSAPLAPSDDSTADAGDLATSRDRVGPGEVADGGLTLAGYVRRFSDACLFAIEAIGMTGHYRGEQNRGFATFETQLALETPAPRLGDGIVVTSGIAAIGTSSLRLVHTMRATRDGRLHARFRQAGVQFDLARRKSAPWPDELRAKAESLVVATA
jgi:acyl-CoA thioesterase FadM